MKIVVAGGRAKADFLIQSLVDKKNQVVAINDGEMYCKYLAGKYDIPVVEGNPCKKDVLDDADITNFDVCVALRPDDAENLAICQMASKIYQIKKTICTVANPRNVELFKELGVTNAISGTYMVASVIEKASMVDELAKTLDLEDGSAVITELAVKKEYPICDEMVMDVNFPDNVIIGCIVRGKEMTVPNGSFVVREKDKLVLISSLQTQKEMLKVITGGDSHDLL